MPQRALETPFGWLCLTETDSAITRLTWLQGETEETPLLLEAERQLRAYCSGTLTAFDLPLHVEASPFQQAVCAAMQAIPFGETRRYGDLAKDLGVPAQAIGQACGGNPIPVLIPCHRVLGASGLGGFSGGTGIETKVQLLRHEGAASLLI